MTPRQRDTNPWPRDEHTWGYWEGVRWAQSSPGGNPPSELEHLDAGYSEAFHEGFVSGATDALESR